MLRNSSHFSIFLKRSTHVFVTMFLISLFMCDPSGCSGGRRKAHRGNRKSLAAPLPPAGLGRLCERRGVARGVSRESVAA